MPKLEDFTPEQIAEGTRVAEEARALVAQIVPMLFTANADDKTVGAAIAEVIGIFLASYPVECQPETLAKLVSLAIKYSAMYAQQREAFEAQKRRPN